ncbi:MAG TPA: SLC13 family permease, partial [Bacteroidia bacterium]|nr:SLC13 family permease [Bacteroidia bacterium]
LGLFITAVIVGSLGWLPLSVTFLLASVVAVGSGAISVSKAYEAIDMRLLILIGGMTAFGFAMSKTGTDQWLADQLVRHLLPFGEMAIMAGFVILTVFLTQPLSNAAAALVVLPVAIETAHRLSVNPMTFGVAVMLSASVSLITPFEPSCILVYGPGRYRFSDFFRTGWLLTALLMAVLMLLVPILWPLH